MVSYIIVPSGIPDHAKVPVILILCNLNSFVFFCIYLMLFLQISHLVCPEYFILYLTRGSETAKKAELCSVSLGSDGSWTAVAQVSCSLW